MSLRIAWLLKCLFVHAHETYLIFVLFTFLLRQRLLLNHGGRHHALSSSTRVKKNFAFPEKYSSGFSHEHLVRLRAALDCLIS